MDYLRRKREEETKLISGLITNYECLKIDGQKETLSGYENECEKEDLGEQRAQISNKTPRSRRRESTFFIILTPRILYNLLFFRAISKLQKWTYRDPFQ